jgi:pyruvate,water dikinase
MASFFRGRRRARTAEEFELLFRHFREVLNRNTRALEIITDMSDVLSGDYLFDIQYVRHAYDQLTDSLQSSVRHFDQLTDDRYPGLRDGYQRIDGSIRSVMEGRPGRPGAYVLRLDKIAEETAPAAGGKIACLASIRRSLPLAVPDGFVITTHAFDAYLRHNRLSEALPVARGPEDDASSWTDDLRERFRQGAVPPDVQREIDRALKRLRSRCGRECSLAVRSSASEEDGDHSFAGQYETALNVPLDADSLARAYRNVLASLYSPRAIAYQQRFGFNPAKIKMAVGCVVMVDAAASGVLYTADPSGKDGRMVIASTWGLGTAVVDGRVDADNIIVSKTDGRVIENRIGDKAVTVLQRCQDGTEEVPTENDWRRRPSINEDQIAQLVRAGALLEGLFRRPQDVEWAIDAEGKLVILQSRPLRIQKATPQVILPPTGGIAKRIEFRGSGIVVQQGIASGTVHVARNDRDLRAVPRGAVLVVKNDSPNLVRVMPVVAAIVTDTGSLTSHMASLAREFRVPTVVNTGDATRVLADVHQVTVELADEAAVYEGKTDGILSRSSGQSSSMEDLNEFRRKRYLLRHIAPLNLVDPFRDDFSPESCRTLHDILRFIHEKSVGRLIEAAGFGAKATGAVKLDLSIPAGITVIDIGGGLEGVRGRGHAALEQISSLPFRAVVQGMVHPGVWRSEPVPLTVNDFLTSMLRAPDLVAESGRQTGTNAAVISQEYVNLSIKFGYHYTILDSYLSDMPRTNHIYFRFAGGATDLAKRSRRLRVIAAVLEEQGFALSAKGDMVIARISNLSREEGERLLEGIGRLISYTRQLDAVLHDDADIDWFSRNFLRGEYELKSRRRPA